jgi:PAS domain S-box-containing protein
LVFHGFKRIVIDRRALRRALAEVLRELRARRSGAWSQNEATKEVGLDVGGLERMERDPALSVLWLLARAFHTTPSRLVMAIDKRYRHLLAEEEANLQAPHKKELDHLRDIAANSPVMTWVANGKKECVYVNQAVLDYTGQAFEQHLGKNWVTFVHQDDYTKTREIVVKAWNHHQAYNHQYRFRHRSGEFLQVIQTAMPHFTRHGVFVGYFGSLILVSEEDWMRIRAPKSPGA